LKTESSKPSLPGPSRSGFRASRFMLWGAAILVAALVVFHGALFRFLAGLLVVEDQPTATDAVVVMGASGPFHAAPFEEAAQIYRDGQAREIVLIEDRSSRLVRAGVVPTLERIGKRQLAERGVPDAALTVLAAEQRTDWDRARQLGAWLDEHPAASATVLCDEFDSRRAYGVCRQVLGAQTAARLRWRAVPDRRYGLSNWWQSRQGIVEFAGAYVALAHTHAVGEPPRDTKRWDPDEYETELKAARR
jgi:hypothetical protein